MRRGARSRFWSVRPARRPLRKALVCRGLRAPPPPSRAISCHRATASDAARSRASSHAPLAAALSCCPVGARRIWRQEWALVAPEMSSASIAKERATIRSFPPSVQCPFDIAPGYGHEVCLSSEISGRVCAGVADLARARNGLGTGRHNTMLPTALSLRVVLRCRIFSRKGRCHERSNLAYFRGCFSPFCDHRGALEERRGPYGGPVLVGPQPPKGR